MAIAVASGTKHTYSDTTTHKRSIADHIDIISPYEVPLVKRLGISTKSMPGLLNWPSTKVW